MPPGESEEQSPGIAAVILPVGNGTPITPVEETRRDPSRSPSALHAPAEILRTASLPCLPVHALAFPLLATTPLRADRDRRPLPHSTGAAAIRFRVKRTSEVHGRSLATIARSAFPPFLIPHQTPPARKPGTIISFTGHIPSCPHSAALLVFLPRSAGTRLVAPDLPGGVALGGHPRPGDFAAGEVHPPGGRGRLPGDLLGLLLPLDLHVVEPLERLRLDPEDEVGKHVESFPLVFLQRVLLRVATEADPLLQVIHREEVVLPQPVDRRKEEHPLEVTHRILAVLLLLLPVGGTGPLLDPGGELLPGQPLHLAFREFLPESELGVDGVPKGGEVPLLRMHLLLRKTAGEVLGDLPRHLHHRVPQRFPRQYLPAHVVDDRALLVHHVVVFEEVLPDVEVVGFDLLLGVFDRLVDQVVLDRLPLFHAELLHEGRDPVRTEDPEEVVLEGQVEPGRPGVPLAPRAAAELVVHAPGLVPLGPDDVETPLPDYPPAELDVHAATGHVRGDRHFAGLARIGDDLRFPLVVLGVEHVVGDAVTVQDAGEPLRLLDGDRPDEDRATRLVQGTDLLMDGLELLLFRAIDLVPEVLPG